MVQNEQEKNKEIDEEIGRDAAKAAMKWYGWGSPIGLGIFFLMLVGIIALIKYIFFG